MNKYLLLAIVLVVGVVADVVTKNWASENLASRSRSWTHTFERTVGEVAPGTTLIEWAEAEFGVDPESESGGALLSSITAGAADDPDARIRLPRTTEIEAGTVLQIGHRQIEVVPGFWNMIYVRNTGAAWGMFADRDERFRRPFFLTVSIGAVVLVILIFRRLRPDQKLLEISLSLVVAGAIGNFIDRVRTGYVVDFVDWYLSWGGDEHHWPTFNVADVWITIGVVLMVFEILFGKSDEEAEEEARERRPAAASAASAAAGDKAAGEAGGDSTGTA